jgi:hypothetical protein
LRLALLGTVQREQSEQLRILDELAYYLGRPTLRAKLTRAIRAEIARLHQMYEATWLELANAFGGQCAEAIRNSIEHSMEPVRQQLELPLGEQKNSELEGDERCKK